jgi:regulator of cell morphogenesis and NO signaling
MLSFLKQRADKCQQAVKKIPLFKQLIKIRFIYKAEYYFARESQFMLLRKAQEIHEEAFAGTIVRQYPRTAEVFNKYGIEYCCGAKWPLKTLCEVKQIDLGQLLSDLQKAGRCIGIHHAIPFENWKIDFLTDYIVNVHHHYLRAQLDPIKRELEKFVREHAKKFPHLHHLVRAYQQLYNAMFPHLQHEEEIIFPYVRQIAHAYESKESYASLLVRTLRKPVEELMHHEHEMVEQILFEFRDLTDNYQLPSSACTSHHLVFSLLKELDDDLVQHIYLESNILFPRAIAMEKELLERPI